MDLCVDNPFMHNNIYGQVNRRRSKGHDMGLCLGKSAGLVHLARSDGPTGFGLLSSLRTFSGQKSKRSLSQPGTRSLDQKCSQTISFIHLMFPEILITKHIILIETKT